MKKKYLMCQIPINMINQHANPNSGLQSLKVFHQEGVEKLFKNKLCMQLSRILKFYRKIWLQIMDFSWWRVRLMSIIQSASRKIMWRTSKTLSFQFRLSAHKSFVRILQVAAFEIMLIYCCKLSDQIRRILILLLDLFHLPKTNKLSDLVSHYPVTANHYTVKFHISRVSFY